VGMLGRFCRGRKRLIILFIWGLLGEIMADFKKRDAERKGDKKQESLRKKLIEENLEDLRGETAEE
jgi:hypothetical protein